ncbi:type II toxin-antitoxin system RelE family toxin [Trinickia caryophylli]|uniref:type II toxin-antitoxin system RelE family toxin n=1 Tax=Trinickia caryophylli TaxID=28094 RepID=UPI000C883BE4|nr:type II toxin-antitoxin system RelE/ParE family toxin [Trinickia caryophylli]PMS11461.1 type II toxin-antitoxin system mRNA interferase toxin, RelE/StbE family [Trinickia caryophylli]TRX17660.1 type II toxin-antitoxin system RelE/ParE family toxin [Trinickia caryophylli]WQE11581.1 type II toxin-antitoxin system RelE/ParE family toxin [Trinickia caryophylli]
MAWRIEISKTAEKQLEKMDREVARRIATFLRRLKVQDDPGATGAALKGSELGEFWKYRVGDWRLATGDWRLATGG